ncbi:hypothetical protein [Thermithiobacillus plumbiphilus]|uniref:DUF4398 domain-containing protein n=1 Tax=Thermithiobacillus plumbiphilus TaxID=1729899 RepID=A0ABU9D909_9PROT
MHLPVLLGALALAGCATNRGPEPQQMLALQDARARVLAIGVEQPSDPATVSEDARQALTRARAALGSGRAALAQGDARSARREALRAQLYLDLLDTSLRTQPAARERAELEASNARLTQEITTLKQAIADLENQLRETE